MQLANRNRERTLVIVASVLSKRLSPRAVRETVRAVERVHLQLVPYPEWTEELPIGLRKVLQALNDEIAVRALLPVLRARNLEEAHARAKRCVVIFYKLWTAYLAVIASWTNEEPSRGRRITQQTKQSDLFTRKVALDRLGPIACQYFAAAMDGRAALPRILSKASSTKPLDKEKQEELEFLGALADYEITLGACIVKSKKPIKVPSGFAEEFAKMAFEDARDAYVIAAAPHYADDSRASVD